MMTPQTIEQVLAQQGRGFFQTVGDSMEPMLHNRKSTVVLEAARRPLRRLEVALYRRPTGAYVLHRVVGVTGDGYRIRGDNRTWTETVPREWILGVMTGYYPDESGRFIPCGSRDYQAYLATLPLRYLRLRARHLAGRVRHILTRRR